jgi:hypothetical protein
VELVTTTEDAHGLDRRFVELAKSGRSNPLTVFEVLRATKGRGAPIGKVVRHECRHDEGQGDCTGAVRVEA